MKRYILHTVLICLLLGVACSKDDTTPGSGTGVLAMTLSATRMPNDGLYDPFDHLTVRIYNSEGGLLRKYTSKEDIPAQLELLAGNYTVAVEAGEISPASFSTRFYKGEETFEVKAGQIKNAEVVCKPVNTIAQVKFDASVVDNFDSGYFAWITGDEAFDEEAAENGSVPALKFTEDGTGYYTLPEGVTSLAWKFQGTHSERGLVEKTGVTPNTLAGGKYVFTFKYSPDLPGFIELFVISFDPSTEDKDDEIIFSPDPSISADGFVIGDIQKYQTGNKTYKIRAFSELESVTVKIGDDTYDALNGTTPGIAFTKIDDGNSTVTLSDAFFAGRTGGDHVVEITATDIKTGTKTTKTTYRLEGYVPVEDSDYSLWANSVTLRVVSYNPAATVQFSLRESEGTWKNITGTREGDYITATFGPEWEDRTAADWSTPAGTEVLPYSRVKSGTGISPEKTYECKAIIGGEEHPDQFTTAAGNTIPNGSFETWKTNQQLPNNGTTKYEFWGSGYNTFAPNLCTRDNTKAGLVGNFCAKLTATYNTLAKVPAPGNLFTADFLISLAPMGGKVSFGKPYEYNARPKAIKFKYHATIGAVNYNLHNGKIPVGEMDKARVFVAIVDWSVQRVVVAGTQAPTGTWDPETQNSVEQGSIIGYASKYIEETTTGDEMVEVTVPINYYQKTSTAPRGQFTIAVSCSTSAYGDFMDACTTNVMYLDNFEWVY